MVRKLGDAPSRTVQDVLVQRVTTTLGRAAHHGA